MEVKIGRSPFPKMVGLKAAGGASAVGTHAPRKADCLEKFLEDEQFRQNQAQAELSMTSQPLGFCPWSPDSADTSRLASRVNIR